MDSKSIDVVEKLIDITPRRKNKRFFCLDCGRDFTALFKKLRNATETKYFRCRGCGRVKYADPGIIAYALITGRRDEVRNPRGEKK